MASIGNNGIILSIDNDNLHSRVHILPSAVMMFKKADRAGCAVSTHQKKSSVRIMKKVWLKKDRRGEMGVGTMIIFIAMILVAAVAASVLIGTANKVREQAQNTGDQAINNVASGFAVQDVTGIVNAGYTQITDLTIQMRLQAGSPSINLDKVNIQVITATGNVMLSFVAGSATGHGGA